MHIKQPYSMLEKPIIENRILKLEERLRLLKDKISFEVKKEKINDLVNNLNNKTIWNNKSLIKELNRELSLLRFDVSILDKLLEDFRDIKEIFRHITANFNKATSITLFDINNELCVLDKKIEQLELSLMFKDKTDKLDCYIDIQAGTGGVDSQDWTSILLRMYLRWASLHRFKTEVIHEMVGDLNKPKSVTIKVLGVYAYGWLRTETGIHRLVRKSPFSSNGKRHTSFSSIYVYPVISDDIKIFIVPSELRIDTFRSSGAGGQHVNKTESAVRITHLPTGLSVECQDERSQYKNKTKALAILNARLNNFELKRKHKEESLIKKTLLGTGYRCDRIRTYNYQQCRITDHRIDLTIYKLTEVLNGDLDLLIQPILNKYYYDESI